MDIETARFNMIEQQIRPWEVLDPAVLSLLAAMRREDFCPPAMRALAFVDTQVPLLSGQANLHRPGPSMLEPKVEARLLQELQVQHHEKVLEIGTGSGFMAALLAHRAQQVFTLECEAVLAATARQNLQRNGVANVTVMHTTAADGAQGLLAQAPFDVIVLSGSVPEVPPHLLAQLKPGGRLVAIVGDEPIMRARLFTRTSEATSAAAFGAVDLFDTVAPRLLGFAEPSRFQF